MKIGVLYNRDLYANKALNLLLPSLVDHELALFHSTGIGKVSDQYAKALQALSEFERKLLPEALDESSAGDRLSFDVLASSAGVQDTALNNINTPEGLAVLQDFAPDLLISIRFGKILRDPVIAIAPKGVINLHSGLLPAYRGVMPTFWAMLKGEEQFGATLHWISDSTIDTGEVIDKCTLEFKTSESYVANVWRLYDLGVELILQAVDAIACRELRPSTIPSVRESGPEGEGNYYSFPTELDMAQFEAAGACLFDEAARQRIIGQH